MRYVILCACVPFLLASGIAGAEWQGNFETIEGVIHVQNPDIPADGVHEMELEKLWSLGGESEEDEEIFGLVQEIVMDPEGRIYLLDQQLAEVRIFDGEGKYLNTVGREGEGPGEFRNPTSVFLFPDGRLGVVQMMPGRVAVMDREGEGYEDFPMPGDGGFSLVESIRRCGDAIALKSMSGSFADGKIQNSLRLVLLDPEGNELALIGEEITEHEAAGGRMTISMGDESFAREWAASEDGRIYAVSGYNGYEIEVFGEAGKLERVIRRDYEPRRRTDEEMADRRAEFEDDTGVLDQDIPETDPDILGLDLRSNGEIWVRTSHGDQEDGFGVVDVFDAEGRFLRQVRPVLEYDNDQDGFVIQGDRLFRIKELNGALRAWAAGFGGNIRVVLSGSEADEDEEGEAEPLEIQAYALPNALLTAP